MTKFAERTNILVMCDMQIPPYLQSRTSSLLQLIFLLTHASQSRVEYRYRILFNACSRPASPHAQPYKFKNNSYP